MAEQIQVLKWLIEIDRETTVAAYVQSEAAYPRCTCLYCHNFSEAIKCLPEQVRDLCAILGIDPAKPSEVLESAPLKGQPDVHLYVGWYHIVGRIVEVDGRTLHADTQLVVTSELLSGWTIHFSNSDSLIPPGFPRPVFALEFTGTIPWLLEEQP